MGGLLTLKRPDNNANCLWRGETIWGFLPIATAAKVSISRTSPTLIVKPAETRGYAALLWRRGYQTLMQAEQSGRYGAPIVWAHGPGRREIARDRLAGDGTLRFRFRPGDPVYRELVSTPGLSAIVTLDRATSRIMGVRFHGRRGG